MITKKTPEFRLTFRRDQRLLFPSPLSVYWLHWACKRKEVLKVRSYSWPQGWTAWDRPLQYSQKIQVEGCHILLHKNLSTIKNMAAHSGIRPLISYLKRRLILAWKLNLRAAWNTADIMKCAYLNWLSPNPKISVNTWLTPGAVKESKFAFAPWNSFFLIDR